VGCSQGRSVELREADTELRLDAIVVVVAAVVAVVVVVSSVVVVSWSGQQSGPIG